MHWKQAALTAHRSELGFAWAVSRGLRRVLRERARGQGSGDVVIGVWISRMGCGSGEQDKATAGRCEPLSGMSMGRSDRSSDRGLDRLTCEQQLALRSSHLECNLIPGWRITG